MQQPNQVPKFTDELRATLEKLIEMGIDDCESKVLLDMLNRGDVELSVAPGGAPPIWLARKSSDLDSLIETGNEMVDSMFELFVERQVAISVYPNPDVRVRFFALPSELN